jgi:hypothetical protein
MRSFAINVVVLAVLVLAIMVIIKIVHHYPV